MDPETATLLSQVYNMINSLPISNNISASELGTLQNMRKALDDKVLRFKEDIARRNEAFQREVKADVDNINRKINEFNNSN